MNEIQPTRPVHRPGDTGYRIMDEGENAYSYPRWTTASQVMEQNRDKLKTDIARRMQELIEQSLINGKRP